MKRLLISIVVALALVACEQQLSVEEENPINRSVIGCTYEDDDAAIWKEDGDLEYHSTITIIFNENILELYQNDSLIDYSQYKFNGLDSITYTSTLYNDVRIAVYEKYIMFNYNFCNYNIGIGKGKYKLTKKQ